MNYTCPVCGYDQLISPPEDYMICPSCGTEFGYTDFATSYEELRRRWIASGARWWSPNTPPPPNWSPVEQLARFTKHALAVRTTETNRYSTVLNQNVAHSNALYEKGRIGAFSASNTRQYVVVP